MKAQLLTLFLAAAATLPAAVAGQDNVWYMDGAAYTGTYDPETHTLSFNGGTMTEERTFTLVAKDPNDPAPTFFRLVGDAPAFLPPGTATAMFSEAIDGYSHPHYALSNKEMSTVGIMEQLPSLAMLEDKISGELAALVEGEYKDASGRKAHITEGSIQLPGQQSHEMKLSSNPGTGEGVIHSDGHSWLFTATRDGLLLRPARASRESSETYEPIAGAKPINLIRLNGTMGRWPMTASAPLQHTMLKHLSTTALLYMRSEILARHGATFKDSPKLRNYFNRQPWYEPGDDAYHLSAIELMNIEIITTEESARAATAP